MGRYGLLVVLALSTAVYACGDDDDDDVIGDGGLDGGNAGNGGSNAGNAGKGAGSGGTSVMTAGAGGSSVSGSGGAGAGGTSAAGTGGTMAPALECGNTVCEAPMGGAMLGVMNCCTDDNECGLMTPLTGECLPMNQPGGTDPSCPKFTVMGFLNWYGCCTPDGQCGAQAGAGLGCVANSELMAPEQSCNYDPNNTCERIVDVACDGNEDCGNGQQCCAIYDGGYRSFECADDCAAGQTAANQQGVQWFEACHPGEDCTDPTYTCGQNLDFLPNFLFRCRDVGDAPELTTGSTAAGEVNCGDFVCGQGQKCCLSVPGNAVCQDENSTCGCSPEGSTEDAGVDEDAGH